MTVIPSSKRLNVALEAIQRFVDERLPIGDAPGATIGITAGEWMIGTLACGVADVVTGAPVTQTMRFQIGSISKSFAAILAMQEVETKRLDLNVPVGDYVPWFSVRSRFAPITLHHLLTHTSGLILGSDVAAEAEADVRALSQTETGFPPGAHFFYSNDGYKLVGLMLEAVTGRRFAELLTERILAPRGMSDTLPTIAAVPPPRAALGHERRPDRPAHRGDPLTVAPWLPWTSADGSIISTASDMSAYARVLLRRGALDYPTHGHARLLDQRSVERMLRQVIEDADEPGVFYGYGLTTRELDGHTIVGHTGSMVGFSSVLAIEPAADLGVVVLLNGVGDRWEIVRFALETMRAAIGGDPLPSVPSPPDPARVANAADYAGVFTIIEAPASGGNLGGGRATGDAGGARTAELAAAGERLLLRHADGDIVLEPDGEDRFLVPHPDLGRFCLHFGRQDGAVVEAFHGPVWMVNEEYAASAAFTAPAEWSAFTGFYDRGGQWRESMHVVLRKGRLWMLAPWLDNREEELVPTGGGRHGTVEFRGGAGEWLPTRIVFDRPHGGRSARAVYDLAAFLRAADL
jgi:D-alanyl-D-alanine carboxypeptidase